VSRPEPARVPGSRHTDAQIPPFNQQANVQAISSDIAVLLSDWVAEAARAPSRAAREFPVGRVSAAVTQYIRELDKGRTETRALYEDIQRELRQWA
jgi:nuclear pore complex protein Nup155